MLLCYTAKIGNYFITYKQNAKKNSDTGKKGDS